jgi:hypothetical protein
MGIIRLEIIEAEVTIRGNLERITVPEKKQFNVNISSASRFGPD